MNRLRNSTRCSTMVISSLLLCHAASPVTKAIITIKISCGIKTLAWIDTSPINGWETTNQMIRHHISQLKGMNTDTEHLEGQSINQPSQNKEDAVRFNIVTKL